MGTTAVVKITGINLRVPVCPSITTDYFLGNVFIMLRELEVNQETKIVIVFSLGYASSIA